MNPLAGMPFNSDHDLLIALLVDFNDTIKEISKKIDGGHADGEKTLELISGVDKRVSDIEKNLEELDIKKIAKQSQANTDWIRDFTTMKHLAWVMASTFFFIIGIFWKPILIFFHLAK